MSAKRWNFYYDEKQNNLTKHNVVDVISLWCAIGLLWVSFFSILGEHFPDFLEVDWGVLWVFLCGLCIPSSNLIPRKYERFAVFVTIVAILIPIWYVLKQLENLAEGLFSMVNEYLYFFNIYQGTSYGVPLGDEEYIPIAATTILMILWMAIWGLSKIAKKPVVLVLFPLTALYLELIIGRSPKGNGVFLILFTALLLMLPSGTKLLRRGIVVAVAMGTVVAAQNMYEKEIELLSEGKDAVLAWVEEFEIPTFELGDFLNMDFYGNSVSINNNVPHYSGEKALKVSSAERPNEVFYLRGYYGNEYANGSWKRNDSAFNSACKEEGYSKEKIAQIVASNPYYLLEESGPLLYTETKLKIEYLGGAGDTAYLPYILEADELEDDINISGDYIVTKEIFDKDISVSAMISVDRETLWRYTYYAKLIDNYEEIHWYNEIVEEYTKGADDMDCIQEIVKKIRENTEYPTEEGLWLSSVAISYDNSTLDEVLENMYRMQLTDKVKAYLADTLAYSLQLDSLPLGTDPIEYALTESQVGYCMHYASAATLILQELGVPARYAQGYIVRPVDFKWDSETQNYAAELEDYSRHAWVEIYLDNIGWIPIEVTEGYEGSDRLPTEGNLDDTPDDLDEEEPSETETETETEPETESETESESETETETENESQTEVESEAETEMPKTTETEIESETEGKDGAGFGRGNGKAEFGKMLLMIALIGGVLFGVGYAVRELIQRYKYALDREIQRKKTKRAVKRMNKRIYRSLCIRKIKKMDTDEKYEQALVEVYKDAVSKEDWHHYMEIVKKAHYSLEDISEEEMMHCYHCYQAISKRFNNLETNA